MKFIHVCFHICPIFFCNYSIDFFRVASFRLAGCFLAGWLISRWMFGWMGELVCLLVFYWCCVLM